MPWKASNEALANTLLVVCMDVGINKNRGQMLKKGRGWTGGEPTSHPSIAQDSKFRCALQQKRRKSVGFRYRGWALSMGSPRGISAHRGDGKCVLVVVVFGRREVSAAPGREISNFPDFFGTALAMDDVEGRWMD